MMIDNNSNFINEFMKNLDDNPYLPVFWIDVEGVIIHVNEAVCQYLGYSREELVSHSLAKVVPGLEPSLLNKLFGIIRKQRVNRFESRHKRKDGVVLDVEVISNYYKTDEREFSVNYVFDITERKNKEKELETAVAEKTAELTKKIEELELSEHKARANEEMLLNAFKTSHDAINLNAIEDGTYIQVNEGFTQIMGYTSEEVVGKSSLELNIWKDPADRARLVEGIKKDGFYHNLEADFVRKDGSVVHGLMSASVQELNGRKVLLNVSKDITKLKKLENELKELNNRLQKKIETEVAVRRKQEEIIFEQKKLSDLGMMINAIAHQWRQPLNVIGLQAQELRFASESGELTPERIEEFEDSQMNIVRYLSSILDDFRNFFKPDTGESEFEVISEVLGLLRLVEIQLSAKKIRLYISCICEGGGAERYSLEDFPECSAGGTVVRGYKGEFKQVIANLIYNSIFAIEEKRRSDEELTSYVLVEIGSFEDKVAVSVKDNGGGVPKSAKQHIFNPYFTTKEEGKGTGLGLYLAKLIIETHMKGRISFENTVDGACFTVEIPKTRN